MKFKNWDGKDISGEVLVTRKIDGVRVEYIDGQPMSRAGKPLYNLPKGLAGIYEVFIKDFKTTIQRTRTHEGKPIEKKHLYHLCPIIDSRLCLHYFMNGCSADDIISLRDKVISEGDEGLVLYLFDGGARLKVKKQETIDVEVVDFIEGTGKYTGMMGALMTTMGKVGTGFTDEDRQTITKDIVGKTIECKCMEITESGKMRQPVFIRIREDKS